MAPLQRKREEIEEERQQKTVLGEHSDLSSSRKFASGTEVGLRFSLSFHVSFISADQDKHNG